MSLTFLLIALIWFLWGVRKPGWDPFAPARLYGMVWFLAISVTTLYLSELQMRWTVWSWVCILGSVLSYVSGVALAGKMGIPCGGRGGTYALVKDVISPGRFLKTVMSLYVVCLAGYLWRVRSAGGVPALASNVEEARWRFYDIESGSTLDRITANLAFLLSAVIVSCALLYFVGRRGKKQQPRKLRWIVLVLLSSAFLLLMSTTFRGAILPPLIVVGVFYHYLRKNFRVITLGFMLILALGLGIGLVVYRHLSSPAYDLSTAYTLAEMRIAPEYALVAEPYTYVALSMDNVVRLFEHSQQPTMGVLTFRPLWTILGIKGMLLDDVHLPFLPAFGFNTATYLFPFYEDFGALGVLILPFLFGWVSGKIYSAMLTDGKLTYVVGYGFVVVLIIFSVLDNLFVFMRFWIEIGILCGALHFSRVKVPLHLRSAFIPGVARIAGEVGPNASSH